MSQKLSLQDSKNEEFKIKQTESELSQKREIEALKEIVSKVQSKQESSDDEMKQLKGRVNQIESQIP